MQYPPECMGKGARAGMASANVTCIEGLRHSDAIPDIQRYVVIGVYACGLVTDVAHVHVMLTITKL